MTSLYKCATLALLSFFIVERCHLCHQDIAHIQAAQQLKHISDHELAHCRDLARACDDHDAGNFRIRPESVL